MTKRWAALIFPSLLGLSVLVHGAILRWANLSSSPPQTALASDLTRVTFILEERVAPPPEPEPRLEHPVEPPLEPPPKKTEEPPTPIQEEVLATESAIKPPQPVPAPTPRLTPRPPQPSPKTAAPTASTAARSLTIAKPDYARNPPPRYPEIARQKGWEGRVMVRATVDATGRVTATALQQSAGFGVLDEAALQAVRGWKFIPRKENGIARDSVVEVPVNFTLRQR